MPAVAKQTRIEEIHQRPQLAEVVLDRRSGEAEPLASFELAQDARGVGVRVLDVLRLVDDHRVPRLGQQNVAVPRQERIGGQHQVVAGDGIEAGLAVRAMQREHLQRRRETLRFGPPVGHQRCGGDDQARPVVAAVQLLGENVRERLHRLAEAHVVGKHAAEPRLTEETQPGIPLALIRPERRGEAFRSGVFGGRPRLSQPLPQNAQRLTARPGDPGAGDQLFQSSEFSGARTAEAELFPIHREVRPEQLVQRGEDRFQPRVRQRQEATVVEGNEQGLVDRRLRDRRSHCRHRRARPSRDR